MATIVKLFSSSLILLCILFTRGIAQCTLSSITISQSKTGKIVEGKPEYEVVVSNNCICSQSELHVGCLGFSTVEDIDPKVFRRDSYNRCTVNDDLPVFQGDQIKFKYAWGNQFELKPSSSHINCS